MTEDIVWRDPPGRTRGPWRSLRSERLTREMRAHPGKWLLFCETAGYSGTYNWLRSNGFEATTRRVAGSYPLRVRLYARWPEGSQS